MRSAGARIPSHPRCGVKSADCIRRSHTHVLFRHRRQVVLALSRCILGQSVIDIQECAHLARITLTG